LKLVTQQLTGHIKKAASLSHEIGQSQSMSGFGGNYTPGAYNFKIQDAPVGASSVLHSNDKSALSVIGGTGGAT
jgi:hypothetical protein